MSTLSKAKIKGKLEYAVRKDYYKAYVKRYRLTEKGRAVGIRASQKYNDKRRLDPIRHAAYMRQLEDLRFKRTITRAKETVLPLFKQFEERFAKKR